MNAARQQQQQRLEWGVRERVKLMNVDMRVVAVELREWERERPPWKGRRGGNKEEDNKDCLLVAIESIKSMDD